MICCFSLWKWICRGWCFIYFCKKLLKWPSDINSFKSHPLGMIGHRQHCPEDKSKTIFISSEKGKPRMMSLYKIIKFAIKSQKSIIFHPYIKVNNNWLPFKGNFTFFFSCSFKIFKYKQVVCLSIKMGTKYFFFLYLFH